MLTTKERETPLARVRRRRRFASAARGAARWAEAVLLTISLWLFVLLIFMPLIVRRHGTDLSSIALDASTVLLSITLALGLFVLFRVTIGWTIRHRVMLLLSSIAVVAVGHALFDIYFTLWISENIVPSWSALPANLDRGYGAAFNYLLVYTVNVALFQLSFARRWSLMQERQILDARTEAQQAQLAALRYQLNPHFLFNALNSISALIVTRRNEDAEQMTERLSSFLRGSLATDPAKLVPLEEELSLIEEYLDIEGVRFGDRINASIECAPEAGEALVPGFLVQPLVENAIKHGVAPSRQPIEIAIRAGVDGGDLCITVANDVPEDTRVATMRRIGVGLDNVRRRLQVVYGEAASLTTQAQDGHYTATICIPGRYSTS